MKPTYEELRKALLDIVTYYADKPVQLQRRDPELQDLIVGATLVLAASAPLNDIVPAK